MATADYKSMFTVILNICLYQFIRHTLIVRAKYKLKEI